MFCGKCGERLNMGAEFCAECGEVVSPTLPDTPPPIPPNVAMGQGMPPPVGVPVPPHGMPAGVPVPPPPNPYGQYGNPYNPTNEYNQQFTFDAPGKKKIKVSGIILLVLSGLVALLMMVSLAGIDVAIEYLENDCRLRPCPNFNVDCVTGICDGTYNAAEFRQSLVFPLAFGLAIAVAGVIVGIMGVIHCNNTQKAGVLQIVIFGYIALRVVDVILAFTMEETNAAAIFGAVTLGFILPIIYLVGVLENKKVV
jgi:hypothetical protein